MFDACVLVFICMWCLCSVCVFGCSLWLFDLLFCWCVCVVTCVVFVYGVIIILWAS